MSNPRDVVRLKSVPIVAYLKDNIIFPFFEVNPGVRSMRMFANIAKDLLNNPHQLHLHFGRNFIAQLS